MFVSHFFLRLFRARFLQIACVLVSGFFLFSLAPSALAADTINHQINYQGKLLDGASAPVSDGAYQMKISLYDVASGGAPVWTAKGTIGTPTALTVTTTDGLFTVLLGDTSVAGGSQNALTGLDWNNDSLYLGLTVSPDSAEMTPRKHLGAVPQSFNSEQLQGMYASSTATSGNALFIVNQTTSDAATSARTALEVRTNGTSDSHDFLIRGLASGSPVFTVSRAGTVTSTNVNVTGGVNGLLPSGILTSGHTSSTVIGTFGSTIRAFIAHGRYGYILSASRNLDIVDLMGANGQGSIANLTTPTFTNMAIAGNFLFGADIVGNLYTIDITSSTAPVRRSTISIGGIAAVGQLQVEGSRLYIGRYELMTVVDISDPLHPRVLGTTAMGSSGYYAVRGSLLYYSDGGGTQMVRIYDVTDPTTFIQLGAISQATPTYIDVQGSLMAVRSNVPGFSLFDVSNPTSPRLLSSNSLGAFSTTKPIIRGRYLFLTIDTGGVNAIQIYDINNPRSPVLVDSISPIYSLSASAIDVAGNTLYGIGSTTLEQYSLNQAEFSGLRAHFADIARLDVRGNSVFDGTGSFLGGLSVVGGSRTERLSAYATGTTATFTAINAASTSTSAGWGAYINTLLIGNSASATGTANYQMVATYNSTLGRGICIDDTSTALTCPSGTATSLIAEGVINGLAFDLAERYTASGDALPGDLLTVDTTASTTVTRTSIPYDPRLFGIVSTNPGFLLGEGGDTSVALAGRVPTHVSPVNGSIAIGDPLTSSQYPGLAMKATKPGRIVGYALEAADTTSTIEVFVKPGYDAGSLLSNDGTNATVNDDLLFDTRAATMDEPLQPSSKLIFRGRAWNGVQALAIDYWLGTEIGSTTSSKWGIHSGTSTLFSIDPSGNAEIQNDLVIGGRLYPSARGVAQHEKYIFMDTGPASSTYMATNADGWQANDSYDFAERYYSPDALTPGDVVVVSKQGRLHVQRAVSSEVLPVGIVSTKPGFVTGAPSTSTYPIALAGRVPTKVSIMNGAISVGDLLAPSSVPGIAVKATHPGPVVGQALEGYTESDIGLIEVFVHAGWWGGTSHDQQSIQGAPSAPAISKTHQGLARILVKGTKVHVSFSSVESYPWVQVTPYSEIEGAWWTANYSETGFDILLKQPQMHELTFAWSVRGLTIDDQNIPISDGSRGDLDLKTGRLPSTEVEESVPVLAPVPDPTPDPVPVPVPVPAPTPSVEENQATSPSEEVSPTPVPVEEEVSAPVEPLPPVIIEESVPIELEEVIVPEPEAIVVPESEESVTPPATEEVTPSL